MKEFDSYRIYYHSAPQYKWQVMLDFYKGPDFVGRALFMKSGEPLPANFMQNGHPRIHYSIADFQSILQILAMDKPLYISLVEVNGIGMISTGSEWAGDLDRL